MGLLKVYFNSNCLSIYLPINLYFIAITFKSTFPEKLYNFQITNIISQNLNLIHLETHRS
jgi:hypothetical protein